MEVITKGATETEELGKRLGRDLIHRLQGPRNFEGRRSPKLRGVAQPRMKPPQNFGGEASKSKSIDKRVIALYGELGSGKTTFIQGLAQGLGIKKRILSPTFIFVRSYSIPFGSKTFHHVDLYRIDKLEDARGLGLKDILTDENALVAIEWAEKIKEILPKNRIDIHFKYLDRDKRGITVKLLK